LGAADLPPVARFLGAIEDVIMVHTAGLAHANSFGTSAAELMHHGKQQNDQRDHKK